MRAGCDGGAHREAAGVMKSAIPQVLDQMGLLDKGTHSDPLRALAAHLSQPGDAAHLFLVHERDETVASDAGADQRAIRRLRRRIVRTPRTEIRAPSDQGKRQQRLG